MSQPAESNRRILIVDDHAAIHADFARLLSAKETEDDSLRASRAALFGATSQGYASSRYQLDSAYQGRESLEMVRRNVQAGTPYAMAFVDSRMPPGWDGIETVSRLWEVDPQLLIVICTAYSDYSWEEMAEILGRPDAFLVLKKPFDAMEVRQLVASLTAKWELARSVERQAREIVSTRDLTVFALAQLADSRDPETGDHLRRMRAYSQLLAEELHRRGDRHFVS